MSKGDRPTDGTENHLSYHYEFRRVNWIDDQLKTYVNKDKLAKVTAQLTKSSVQEVEDSIDFVFKNLRYWLDNPRIRGSYSIRN